MGDDVPLLGHAESVPLIIFPGAQPSLFAIITPPDALLKSLHTYGCIDDKPEVASWTSASGAFVLLRKVRQTGRRLKQTVPERTHLLPFHFI
jgi:hypothetical protein